MIPGLIQVTDHTASNNCKRVHMTAQSAIYGEVLRVCQDIVAHVSGIKLG